MSDTSDTSTIDNKKNASTNSSINVKKFITNLISLLLFFIIYFSLGGLTLWGCKLAQSNILPTEGKCFPYTYYKPKIEDILINLFITFTNPSLSMKIKFPYDDFNASNRVIDMFRNYKNEPNSNFLTNYFIEITESLLLFNYSSLNFILNALNTIPEILIVVFGPIVISISLFFIFLFDHLYLIYLWFASMSWFFKVNTNENQTGKPVWEQVSILDTTNYICAFGLVFVFCCLFWVLLMGLPVLPFITLTIVFINILGYKAEMNNKKVNALTIVKDVFKYYKVTITSIFSILVVISAFTNLGNIPGIISLVVLLLIYFGLISVDLFKPTDETNLSALVSNNQAKKACHLNEPLKRARSFLSSFFRGGGYNLTKELKKLAKKMENNEMS